MAKVRALREAFVEEFGGMYDEDEIQDTIQPAPQKADPLDSNVIDVSFEQKDELMEAAAQAVRGAKEVDINSL